jgi:hypothetical protein
MKGRSECRLADGFSVWEKMYAQFSFFAVGIIGTVGILLVDWRWAPLYVFIYVYGILGIVMRHLTCPRCPHLHVYKDCLQFPTAITRRLVKERKTTSFSAPEKSLFCAIFILIATLPVYWLLSNPILLGGFLIAASMWYLGQFLYFCKRCRVSECPFNRAKASSRT